MESHIVKLLKKEEVAEKTIAFKLEKPEGFEFAPGQYMQVFLSEDKNDSRTFSIASAPHEDFLMFATRIREGSDFKLRLTQLNEGDEIRIEAPGGKFLLPADQTPVGLLVGGIGITTVRSMVKNEEHGRTEREITVFYSNKKPEEAAFLHEFETIALPNYRLVATMSDVKPDRKEWSGETGEINETMLKKYVKDLSLPVFYAVGPPGFVEGMISLLYSMNNVPSTHVRSEDYAGY